MTGNSHTADVKFRCRLRRAKDGRTTDSEYSEPIEIYCYIRHATRTREQRLSFNPIAKPPSRPSSRIRTSSQMRAISPVNSPDSQTATSPRNFNDWNLPNPKYHRRGKGTRAAPQRLQPRSSSPDPSYSSSMAYRTKRTTTGPTYSATMISRTLSTDAAAACFAIDISRTHSCQSECGIVDDSSMTEKVDDEYRPFSVPLTEFTTVEVDKDTHDMSSRKCVSVILIGTQNNGFLELTPHSGHGGDLLVAYLQASLPTGIIMEDRTLVAMKSTQSDRSLDMQRFEGKAVEKRFLNESFWDRMKRRSARVATRFPEFCHCLEPVSFDDEDDAMENSSFMEDKTVASILTEMELDDGHDRVQSGPKNTDKLKSEATPNITQAVV